MAFHEHWHPDLDRGAGHRFFQGKLQVVAQVGSAMHTGSTAAATPEDISEHISKDVAETATAPETAGPSAQGRVHPGVPELVVCGPFLRVGEHLVGLLGLFECLLCLFAGVAVWVILHGQSAVGLFQLRLAGILADPQHFIVIAFRHC